MANSHLLVNTVSRVFSTGFPGVAGTIDTSDSTHLEGEHRNGSPSTPSTGKPTVLSSKSSSSRTFFSNETVQPYGTCGRRPPGIRVGIVNNVSTPRDRDALLTQRCAPLANLVVEGWRSGFVTAQLYDGNVSLWINVAEHRPSAMDSYGLSVCFSEMASLGSSHNRPASAEDHEQFGRKRKRGLPSSA
jgi:hypothetical protein